MCAIALHAQVVSPDSTSVVYVDSLQRWVERTLSFDGVLYSEKQYLDSTLQTIDGMETYFYSAGRIKSVAHYTKGKLNGEVTSFYSDGRKRRVDVFENDRFIEGTCYGANGMMIPHTDYKKDVAYPGGLPALYSVVTANAQRLDFPEGEHVSGTVAIRLYVDKKGKVTERVVVTPLHPMCDEEALRISEHLSKFEPAERDMETVPGYYYVVLKFDY